MVPPRPIGFALYVIMALVTLGFGLLLVYFAIPVFWAAVIAIIFHPIYERLTNFLNPSGASLLMLLLVVVIVILPAALLAFFIYIESIHLISRLQGNNFEFLQQTVAAVRETLQTDFFARLGITESMLVERVSEAARSFVDYLLLLLRGITQNTLVMVANFVVMLYCLFFFIRDGRKIMGRLESISPLGGEIDSFLVGRLASTLRVTLKTMFIIGGLQGFLGGLVFFIIGMDGAVIWGVIMMFASLLPAVGTGIILAPVGIAMFVGGHIWEGVVIFASGFFVIGMVDNLLRPVLIGREAEIHPLLIFLSSLGGILVFGFSGLLIGPLGAALFIAIWRVYFKQNQTQEPASPPSPG